MLKDENALTKNYGLLFDMVNNDPKTLLYHGYHDYSKEPRWRNLVDLDIQGRNSIALLKSQQTFQQTFQQSFQYYRVSHTTIKTVEKSVEISTKLLN